ncbi:hypothetical protein J7J49_06610 [Halomonas sp. ISL-56]|uniref:hypothetical protein n=1 Tax=Halomonas sp. ISL-56 TaxID=2819149 RepID=UPI001BEAE0B1|nr:hypothetical protein [Halomonas sp. ISL-56]MBT2800988.1 hypothetical protein [Halomonas sp. ISL-56]
MHVFGYYRRFTTGLSALLISGMVNASPEQLEADFRERMIGEDDRLTFSRIYEDSEQQRYIAEDIAITHANGDVITLERYSVEGAYEHPDQVVMESIVFREVGQADPLLSIATLVLPQPSRAVFSAEDFDQAVESVSFNAVTASDIMLRMDDGAAESALTEMSHTPVKGYIHIDDFTLEGLNRSALELLNIEGISAEFKYLESGITSELALTNLRIEQLVGLDNPGAESVEHAELNGFSLTGDDWRVLLDKLWVNGSNHTGDAGFEGAYFDVAELIRLAPPDDREAIQSLSNVLTGGTGQLRAEGRNHSRWEEADEGNRLISEGFLTLSGAAGFEFTMDLPITLPKGVTIEQATQNPALLELATLHGGDVVVAYSDEGLLPRIATEMASQQGIPEERVISQIAAQAQQFGQLLGPQVSKLMTGMVDIMAGYSQQLTVNVAFPNPFMLNQFIMNPMGNVDQLRFSYQLE